MLLPVADPDADLEQSLAHWRRYRKRRRIADIDWVDALYRADLTALLGGAAIYALAGIIGGERLTTQELHWVATNGADCLGVVVALVLAVGLRSGSRGGPLVLEHADVRHVLLAPVDRTTALRGPALRQLRFLAFVAALVGLVVGVLAARRLGPPVAAWMGSSALFTVATVALGYGAALVAAAVRLPSWIGTALGVALVGVAVADAVDAVEGSPLTAWGHLGLWPDAFSPQLVVALIVTLAVLGVGFARVGDVSLEAAERRSTLVGQLRFAATLRDLRTVIVLRRQLALELPRLRPWLTVKVRGTSRFPVWTRGWQGVLRWPAARMGRLVLLAAVAGLALRGVWEGITPLLILAGLALYVAGLDAVEPLAQEVDHPSRSQSFPVVRGSLQLRHLAVAVTTMLVVATVAAAAGLLVEPTASGALVAAACIVPAALGGVGGAAFSTLSDPLAAGGGDGGWSLVAPETAGMVLAVRTALPPALAIGGTLPLLAARAAFDDGASAVDAASTAGVAVLVGFGLVAVWVRAREELRARWEASLEHTFPSRK